MNRDIKPATRLTDTDAFNPNTSRTRTLSVCAAVLATAGMAASVLALASHYDDEFLQVARAQTAISTQHAMAPAPSSAQAPVFGQGVPVNHANQAHHG